MSKYIYSIWKKKTATVQVMMFTWEWESVVNGRKVWEYFPRWDLCDIIYSPLKLCKMKKWFYFTAKVSGSGISSQAYAIRHWLSKALAHDSIE